MMAVPVNLTPAEEAALAARARAEGVSVESLLRGAVLHLIVTGEDEAPAKSHAGLSADQWEAELVKWLDGMPDFQPLSDEAIGREGIYTREDEWR
jgi:hypothetical protein